MPVPISHPGVYVREVPSGVRAIEGVATAICAFVGRAPRGPADEPVPLTGFTEFERTFGDLSLDSPMSFAVRDFFMNGGRQAIVVRVAAQIVPADGIEGRKGIYALEKADLFNLVVIPPHALDDGNDIDAKVIAAATAYCERRGAILLLDSPSTWTSVSAAESGVADQVGEPSGNAAIYFPRLLQPNPLRGGRVERFAPSGAVAGLIARIDAQRGVWKAPAGVEARLTSVPALDMTLSDMDHGSLNPLGVNCLRQMPNGIVVWGARTLAGNDRQASEWKYLSVRRTALFIEQSIHRGTDWVAFEPNGEALWAQLRLSAGAFMQRLFRQRAFQGASAREAYFVKCDAGTTPQADIARGIVTMLIGFAPLKPAEFVIVRVRRTTAEFGGDGT